MRAVVHLPGEGEQIGGPSSVTIKVTGKDTAGSVYLGEAVIAPGFTGPPLTSTSGSTTCFTFSTAR